MIEPFDFSTLDLIPLARKRDPVTSHVAAKKAQAFANSHAGRIRHELIAAGPGTAHELSLMVGLTVVQVDRRLPELARKGLAAVTFDASTGEDVTRNGFRVWMAI